MLRILAASLAWSVGLLGQGQSDVYRIERVFDDQAVHFPSSIVRSAAGDLFLLDNNNHRILAFREGRFLRQIGQIGQTDGDLHQPSALGIDSSNRLYVVDQENSRIQVFQGDGAPYGRFPADTHTNTIAISSSGEILINNPNKKALITVYSRRGREVRTSGQLVPLSRGFPGRPDDEKMLVPLGRAYLSVDASGIYVTFQFMPLVQKYTEKGGFLWEARLTGEAVNDLVRTFWKEPGSKRPKSSRAFDGLSLPDIVTAATIAANGNLLAVLADRTICVLSPDGAQLRQLRLDPPRSGPFYGIGEHQGTLYFTDVRRIYRSTAPLDLTAP